jgi:hypothetical protein
MGPPAANTPTGTANVAVIVVTARRSRRHIEASQRVSRHTITTVAAVFNNRHHELPTLQCLPHTASVMRPSSPTPITHDICHRRRFLPLTVASATSPMSGLRLKNSTDQIRIARSPSTSIPR